MIGQLKTISLAIAFLAPLSWAVALLLDGLKGKKSRVFLFLLLLAAAFTYTMTFAKFSEFFIFYSRLFPFQAGVVLTLFPLFYLYILSLISEKKLDFKRIIPHFIFPFSVFITFLVLQKVFLSKLEEKNFVLYLADYITEAENRTFNVGKLIYDIGKAGYVISSIVYSIILFVKLKCHSKKTLNYFAADEDTGLNWFRFMLIAFVLTLIFYIIIHVISNSVVAENSILIITSYTVFGTFFWMLGLIGFKQVEIYNPIEIKQIDNFEQGIKICREKLEEYMISHKPYKNPNVSLFDFCYHFHTNRTYLSESIKHAYNKNFRGLINYYRIRDALDEIEKSSKKNVIPEFETIAKNAGFTSYSTFLRVFKSELGITPSDYLKSKFSFTSGKAL
jgi:AraC-like DNA-binding protein